MLPVKSVPAKSRGGLGVHAHRSRRVLLRYRSRLRHRRAHGSWLLPGPAQRTDHRHRVGPRAQGGDGGGTADRAGATAPISFIVAAILIFGFLIK